MYNYFCPAELVTKHDKTNEFASLCNLLEVNPAVTKYRNQTSKRASVASSKPRYGADETASSPELASTSSPKHKTSSTATGNSGKGVMSPPPLVPPPPQQSSHNSRHYFCAHFWG